MGRGANQLVSSGTSLLFGRGRHGTRQLKLSATELAEQHDRQLVADFIKAGGEVVESNQGRSWLVDGALHREDGPAFESADGVYEWWYEGAQHRTGGPAVEWADGAQMWFEYGSRHRTDGPAVEHPNGDREWWVSGELHREDGPAFNHADSPPLWAWHGQPFTDEVSWQAAKNSQPSPA